MVKQPVGAGPLLQFLPRSETGRGGDVGMGLHGGAVSSRLAVGDLDKKSLYTVIPRWYTINVRLSLMRIDKIMSQVIQLEERFQSLPPEAR